MNYFLGIDATSGKLVADFEEAQGGSAPSANHPISGTRRSPSEAFGTMLPPPTTDDMASVSRRRTRTARSPSANRPTPDQHADDCGHFPYDAGVAAGFFAGVVDEVRIWNVARTAAQIAAAKDTEITGTQAGLLGRWGLNEASGINCGR